MVTAFWERYGIISAGDLFPAIHREQTGNAKEKGRVPDT